MKKTESIPFAALRAILIRLGYAEKRTPKALIFNHPKEGLIVFRAYRDEDAVADHDVVSTRKFLDMRGQMEANDFDSRLFRTPTSA